MAKNIKNTILLIFMLVVSISAQAQTQDDYIAKHKSDTEKKLLSENVTSGFDLVAVDSMMLRMTMKAEAEAKIEELYEELWDTRYVKAYGSVEVPDIFTLDVSGFVMPVEGRVTSNYGMRKRRYHYGTDIKLQRGDTVRAAFDGKVRVRRYERRGYGYYIVLRHNNGLESVYGHFSKFLVEQDQEVKAGDPIGLGGNTGRSSGPHLHLEFRFLGVAFDPADIIDFDQFCMKDDVYVFQKKRSGKYSKNSKAVSGSSVLAQSDSSVKYYTIKSGDNLGAIAKRYRTTVSKLCKLNNIKQTTILKIGRRLRVS
ncbi:hypothetical protein M2138_001905 [Dysgonomonadaceae bacterium PH5-43]|nr:hypothetical protein [Dysgonomonadaceae bacterium PH5-43]